MRGFLATPNATHGELLDEHCLQPPQPAQREVTRVVQNESPAEWGLLLAPSAHEHWPATSCCSPCSRTARIWCCAGHWSG